MSLISIITINFNDAAGLEETIRSVASQTFRDYEHLVIDGDSNDGSKDVINKYRDQLTHAVSEPDTGIYNAMNKGIRASNGDFLLFLNSGDCLLDEGILQESSNHLQASTSIFYGRLLAGDLSDHIELTFPSDLTFHYFFYQGYLPHPATFIKKDLFDQIGLYNEGLKIAADWEFFVVAICKHNVNYKNLDFAITLYDVHGISSNPKQRKLLLDEKQWILEKHFPLFLKDANDFQLNKELLNSNRFKLLMKIEQSRIARRLTTLWLRLVSFLFVRDEK